MNIKIKEAQMGRNIAFECNKLHGFLRMNNFVDEHLVPCVRSKVVDYNVKSDKMDNNIYTLKVVKEIDATCKNCDSFECGKCAKIKNLYNDFGLPIKKRIRMKDFDAEIKKLVEFDNDYIFYYYKYFSANLFGKLIIDDDYYVIEVVDENNTDICLETKFFWRNACNSYSCMKMLSDKQIVDIISYAKIVKEKMNLYIKSGYSLVLDFAFTTQRYFGSDSFSNTNLLFYGMRTAYNKADIAEPLDF